MDHNAKKDRLPSQKNQGGFPGFTYNNCLIRLRLKSGLVGNAQPTSALNYELPKLRFRLQSLLPQPLLPHRPSDDPILRQSLGRHR